MGLSGASSSASGGPSDGSGRIVNTVAEGQSEEVPGEDRAVQCLSPFCLPPFGPSGSSSFPTVNGGLGAPLLTEDSQRLQNLFGHFE